MVIEEAHPFLNALDSLKKYNKDEIHLDRIDEMYCSNYSPSCDPESDLDPVFEKNGQGAPRPRDDYT